MTLTGAQLLLLYLCLFLGMVFFLWFFGGWKASRAEKKATEKVTCPACGVRSARGHAWFSHRCGECGARRPLQAKD